MQTRSAVLLRLNLLIKCIRRMCYVLREDCLILSSTGDNNKNGRKKEEKFKRDFNFKFVLIEYSSNFVKTNRFLEKFCISCIIDIFNFEASS